MKKQLLTGAMILLGITALVPTIDAKSSMDNALSLEWMNTDVAPLELDCRQGFGMNGKFYIQNKATQKIEVWNETGKLEEIPSGGGTNITRDDAGNIIVRLGTFNTDYTDKSRNEMRIISADRTRTVDIPLSGITAGRLDFWGNIKGNVLDATKGGVLHMGTNWHGFITEIPIINGAQDVTNTYQYAYANPFKTAGTFTTTSLLSGWEGIEDFTLLIPYNGATGKTTGNSIQKMVIDNDGNWVIDSYFITPRHNGCTGYCVFKIGDQKLIVYSTGSNDGDGFSIAKLATKASSTTEDSDESYRLATKYAETGDDGNVTYKNNAFYANHFSVDPIDATSCYIYQYFPKGYIAKYKFDLSKTGVEGVGVDHPTAKVFGGVGEITIDGEASSIQVYTVGGALLSSGSSKVNCAPGMYIVKVDGKATKVIVK